MKSTINHLPESFGFRNGSDKFPSMVVVGFSYLCNSRCPSCPYTTTSIRSKYDDAKFIGEKLFKKIAEECGKYSSFLRISGGGEPMLHPKAISLLSYAKKVGSRVGLITNGSRLSNKSVDALLDVGIDVIEFSVDAGDKETYSKVRPGLNWNKLVRTVTYLKKSRDTLNSKTRIIASVINQLGVDVSGAEVFWESLVDKVQIRKYLTWGYGNDKSASTEPYLNPEDNIPCPWLFERINVDSRGDVTICGEDIDFTYKFANINEMSIEELWHMRELEELRQLHLSKRGNEHPACSVCPDWKYRSWEHNYWKLIK